MRYVISCKRCEFSADAKDIRDLGLQLNRHTSSCLDDPLLVLVKDNPGECAVDVLGKTAVTREAEIRKATLCA